MGDKDPTSLRGNAGHRSFEVSFRNEGAIDAGGPYREAYTLLAEDLMSDRMTMFINPLAGGAVETAASGGGHASAGAGGVPPVLVRQSSITTAEIASPLMPNPAANSDVEKKLFRFMGRFMGMVMRQQIYVPLQLGSVFWKGVSGASCNELDLQRADYDTWSLIDQVRRDAARLSGRDFVSKHEGLQFAVRATDGAMVELVPRGRNRPVTRETAEQWA